ncbi:MAG: antibiotic biosynthesis monooxygenase [Nitrospiraceae bacterium]|nr:antibiotic biosynthesis monooxygenase [Nitrospiraceae bacterium]
MVTIIVIVRVIPEKREEFLQTARTLKQDMLKVEGVKRIILYQDMEDRERFLLIVEWTTPEGMDKYLHSENFRVLIGALRVLAAKSEVTFSLLPDDGEKIAEIAI